MAKEMTMKKYELKRFENWDDEILDTLRDEDDYIRPQVGMGVTYSPYTDEYPYEIVEVISDKKIKVRKLESFATKENGIYTGDVELFSKETNEVIELKKLKYGWKRNSKDTGRWYVGRAERYEDPSW